MKMVENVPPDQTFVIPLVKASTERFLLGDCPTCMDPMYSDNTVNMSCGHLFHVTCTNSWKPRTCPLCRSKYTQVKEDHVQGLKTCQEEKSSHTDEILHLIQRIEQVEQNQQEMRQIIDLTGPNVSINPVSFWMQNF
jgi:hypothetical protein